MKSGYKSGYERFIAPATVGGMLLSAVLAFAAIQKADFPDTAPLSPDFAASATAKAAKLLIHAPAFAPSPATLRQEAMDTQKAHAAFSAATWNNPDWSPALAPREGTLVEMAGKSFVIQPDVMDALEKASMRTGIPLDVMIAICGRESDCNPASINKTSGACGITQFMVRRVHTLYETAYKYAAEEGYPEVAALVERVNLAKDNAPAVWDYLPVKHNGSRKAAQKKLLEYCLNADFNLAMFVRDFLPKAQLYKEMIGGRDLFAGELALLNNLGPKGLYAFVNQATKDKNKKGSAMLVKDFFADKARLFGGMVTLTRDDHDLTVKAAWNDIISTYGGWQKIALFDRARPANDDKLDIEARLALGG